MMSRLLALAAGYCARLSRASIDFVCLEDVSEKIYDWRVHYPSSTGPALPSWRNEPVGHRYVYDYQFIVENGNRTEKRRVLELDGVKKEGEDTELDTQTFFYKNVMFGAVDLMAESRQSFYRYELKARESQGGQAVAVIEAVPIPGLAVAVNRGTIWIRESDGAILKIVWNDRMMQETEAIRETARRLKSTPQILQVTEFGFEKNGVRFPNRFSIEEAYVNKKGKKSLRSTLNVVYRDYKFFTVVVDTSVIK